MLREIHFADFSNVKFAAEKTRMVDNNITINDVCLIMRALFNVEDEKVFDISFEGPDGDVIIPKTNVTDLFIIVPNYSKSFYARKEIVQHMKECKIFGENLFGKFMKISNDLDYQVDDCAL